MEYGRMLDSWIVVDPWWLYQRCINEGTVVALLGTGEGDVWRLAVCVICHLVTRRHLLCDRGEMLRRVSDTTLGGRNACACLIGLWRGLWHWPRCFCRRVYMLSGHVWLCTWPLLLGVAWIWIGTTCFCVPGVCVRERGHITNRGCSVNEYCFTIHGLTSSYNQEDGCYRTLSIMNVSENLSMLFKDLVTRTYLLFMHSRWCVWDYYIWSVLLSLFRPHGTWEQGWSPCLEQLEMSHTMSRGWLCLLQHLLHWRNCWWRQAARQQLRVCLSMVCRLVYFYTYTGGFKLNLDHKHHHLGAMNSGGLATMWATWVKLTLSDKKPLMGHSWALQLNWLG